MGGRVVEGLLDAGWHMSNYSPEVAQNIAVQRAKVGRSLLKSIRSPAPDVSSMVLNFG